MNEEIEYPRHPPHYLRCVKIVDGVEVVTGWAPDVETAGRHAGSVGGDVVAYDKNGVEVASFSDPYPRQVDLVGHSTSYLDDVSLASGSDSCYSSCSQ